MVLRIYIHTHQTKDAGSKFLQGKYQNLTDRNDKEIKEKKGEKI